MGLLTWDLSSGTIYPIVPEGEKKSLYWFNLAYFQAHQLSLSLPVQVILWLRLDQAVLAKLLRQVNYRNLPGFWVDQKPEDMQSLQAS